MKKTNIILLLLAVIALASCADDDSFSTSPGSRLTFSADTVRMDTLFSNVPSAAQSFWVYNRSGDGLRLTDVRLERGGSSGFRVNVDGIYLGEERDYRTSEIEIRNKDSIRVFVEVTLPTASADEPTLDEDNLVFTLENGVEQRVNLNAWAWNATLLRNVHITGDSLLDTGGRPTVVYGGLVVDSAATLTLAPGTTLYFHSDAGIDVYGTLHANGTAEAPVTLRGDRIDHMFGYLPYDRVPAQWIGMRLHESSYGNELLYTDLHSANTGIEIDSSDVSQQKLTLSHSTVHNCQGYGVHAANSRVTILNSQITNSLYDCLSLEGGYTNINGCTIAQFYPFDSRRGSAFAFSDSYPMLSLEVRNTLITGYADDVFTGSVSDTAAAKNWLFDHCIIRTPKIETDDSLLFTSVTYEDTQDTVSMGEKHFRKIDIGNQAYDFHLDSLSAAIGKADSLTALPDDHDGLRRDGEPDIGAYEYVK